jgi:pimeloyl-ACP methyl ester carboxylesterase
MVRFDHKSGRQLQVDDAQIYVEEHGSADAPVLLLLHGGLGTIEDFNSVLPRLAQRFRVVGVDSRGHGASTLGKAAWTYGQVQRDIEQVVQQLGLQRFAAMGFSDGGIVGLRLAAAKRVNISKLVAIGAPLELEETNRAIYQNLTAEGWRKKFPETYERYQTLNPAPDFERLVKALVRGWLDESDEGYPLDSAKQVACDVLVVRGDEDHLVSRATTFDLVDLLPNAKLLNLPYAGHEVTADQPEALLATVDRFLSD